MQFLEMHLSYGIVWFPADVVGAVNTAYLCAIPERDGVQLADQRLVPPLADDRDACYQALNQIAKIELLFLVFLLHCLLLKSSKLRQQAATNGSI